MHRLAGSLFLVLCLHTIGVAQLTVYVSTAGSDTNSGTIDHPFLTVSKAYSAIAAGDTIYIRGGTFNLSSTISLSNKSGSDSTKRCYLFAYPGEKPVFDFTAQASSDGIKVNGNYWYLKGLESRYAAHNGIAVNGSHNTIENCSVHDNRNTGMQLGNGASFNRIINCDSYFNYDPPLGGNADGFSPKLDVGTGNYFYGCRSWQNSDDGWDGYMRPSDNISTTLENCWSFMNGHLKDGSEISSGNGNGFKMGGGDNSNADSLRHNMILRNCLSFDNRVKGFDQNNNRGSMTLINCTAYRNGTYNFSIPGIRRAGETVTLVNCVSLGSSGITLLDPIVQSTDSWSNSFNVSAADFVSLDTAGVRGPRKSDGSLPNITFMHLSGGSRLIDAGTPVGLPFNGTAPDLGAFEYANPTWVKNALASRSTQTHMLLQNYPNPFNPSTTISFTVQQDGPVTLKVYNTLGQIVTDLFKGAARREELYKVEFDAHFLTSGTYFCILSANGSRSIRKMVLLK